jgi:myo-inositol-1(or 4)-monophosphatase
MDLNASLIALLTETGTFAAEEFARFDDNRVEYKAENDPFSFVDVEADRRLREGCEQLIPGSGFINEELENREGTNDYRWIIDPIDGTSNFTHGIPHFCISLALQKAEETILGYVYQPLTQELFRAEKGKGATLNGDPIYRSDRQQLNLAVVATGFPYAVETWVADYLTMIYAIMQQTHGLRRFGSAALDLAYVAAGRLDVFLEFNLKPWDVAAGSLIVQEAGGQVSDFTGGDRYVFGGEMLATNGHVHQPMLEILGQSPMIQQLKR